MTILIKRSEEPLYVSQAIGGVIFKGDFKDRICGNSITWTSASFFEKLLIRLHLDKLFGIEVADNRRSGE